MTRRMDIGGVFTDVFPVFEPDGFTKHSGVTSFVVVLLRDGFESVLPVTIDEIGTTGDYKVSFTPDAVGVWNIQVFNSYDNVWWGTVVEVIYTSITTEARVSVAFDDSVGRFFMEAWLERGNTIIPKADLISCEVTLLDYVGTEIFTVTSTTPKDDDHFSLYYDTPLDDDRVYNLIVTIIDTVGSVVSHHSFGTVS
jgi:hypothetical protein